MHTVRGMSICDKYVSLTDRRMNIIQPEHAHTGLREGLIILNKKDVKHALLFYVSTQMSKLVWTLNT